MKWCRHVGGSQRRHHNRETRGGKTAHPWMWHAYRSVENTPASSRKPWFGSRSVFNALQTSRAQGSLSALFPPLHLSVLQHRPTMVEQSDRAPLLDWEEIPPPDPNHQAAQPPPPSPPPLPPEPEERSTEAEKTSHPAGRRLPPPATAVSTAVTYSPSRNVTAVVVSRDRSLQPAELSGFGWDRPEFFGTDRHLPFPCVTARDQWDEKDQIVAVFVVTFDTRSGKKTRICSFYFAENEHQVLWFLPQFIMKSFISPLEEETPLWRKLHFFLWTKSWHLSSVWGACIKMNMGIPQGSVLGPDLFSQSSTLEQF